MVISSKIIKQVLCPNCLVPVDVVETYYREFNFPWIDFHCLGCGMTISQTISWTDKKEVNKMRLFQGFHPLKVLPRKQVTKISDLRGFQENPVV